MNPPINADGRAITEPLGRPGTARAVSAGASSTNLELTADCRRISMRAEGAAIRFAIGVGAQTAGTANHFIGAGERLDFSVLPGTNIAAIRASGTSGTLEITELV